MCHIRSCSTRRTCLLSYFVQHFSSAFHTGCLALLRALSERVSDADGLGEGGFHWLLLIVWYSLSLSFPSLSTASLRSNTGLPSRFVLDESDLVPPPLPPPLPPLPPPLPPPLSPLCLFFSFCSCLFRSATCFESPLSSLTSSLVGGSTENPASLSVAFRILLCSPKSAGAAPVALLWLVLTTWTW